MARDQISCNYVILLMCLNECRLFLGACQIRKKYTCTCILESGSPGLMTGDAVVAAKRGKTPPKATFFMLNCGYSKKIAFLMFVWFVIYLWVLYNIYGCKLTINASCQ